MLHDLVHGDIATIHGSPSWVPSPYGSAISFTSSSQWADGTDKNWVGYGGDVWEGVTNIWDALAPRAIGVVFALNATPSGYSAIVSYGTAWVGSRGIFVGVTDASYFGANGYDGAVVTGATPVIDTNAWHVGLVNFYPYWGLGNPGYWFTHLDSYHEYGEWINDYTSWDTAGYSRHTYTNILPGYGWGLDFANRADGAYPFNGRIAGIFQWDRRLKPNEITSFFADPFEAFRLPLKRFLFAPSAGPIDVSPDSIAATLATHAPTVTRIITPATIATTLATHAPNVTRGAVVIAPATVTPTLATHAPSMTLGAQVIAPATVTPTLATHAPSVALGVQVVAPDTIAVTLATHAPAMTGGAQALQPTTITGTATHAPTVTRQALVVAPTAISSGSAAYAPEASLGGQSANPTTITGTATHSPTVTRGAVSIGVGTITSGSATHNPSLSFRALPITPLTIFGTSLFEPELFQGVKIISPASIGPDSHIFSPVVRSYQTLGIDTITSETLVSGPSMALGGITLSIPAISTTTQVFQLTIFGARRGPTTYLSITIPMTGVPDPHRSTVESS